MKLFTAKLNEKPKRKKQQADSAVVWKIEKVCTGSKCIAHNMFFVVVIIIILNFVCIFV